MHDSELTDRPGKGWTPWRDCGASEISRVWWQAKELHFPKLNVTCWFDGSDLVGIEHWGYRRPQCCMRKPPPDWQPMPAGYRERAEATWRVARKGYPLDGQRSRRRVAAQKLSRSIFVRMNEMRSMASDSPAREAE